MSTNTYHTFLICFHFCFISVLYMCVCMCGIYIVIDFYLTMYTQLGRWFHIKDYVQNFFVTWCIVSVSWQVESVMMIYWHNFFSLFFRKLSFQVKVIKFSFLSSCLLNNVNYHLSYICHFYLFVILCLYCMWSVDLSYLYKCLTYTGYLVVYAVYVI